jgi:hypothetical protein
VEPTIIAAIVGALGGFISGALGARASMTAKRMDKEVEREKLWVSAYEKTLLDARLADYRSLWALTESTSRRHVDALSADRADSLAEELTRWYYRNGGILLTSRSRDAFFHARESVTLFRSNPNNVSRVVEAFSDLRTALCDDLNSRSGPSLVGGENGKGDEEVSEEMLTLARSDEKAWQVNRHRP